MEELLKCTACKEFLSLDCFYPLGEGVYPTWKRRYYYHCIECTNTRQKQRYQLPHIQEYHRQYRLTHKKEIAVAKSRSRKQRSEYYRLVNEPCDKTPGCEKTLYHEYYCRVNGITLTPPEENARQRQAYRQRQLVRKAANNSGVGSTGRYHLWRAYNQVIFKNNLAARGGN